MTCISPLGYETDGGDQGIRVSWVWNIWEEQRKYLEPRGDADKKQLADLHSRYGSCYSDGR